MEDRQHTAQHHGQHLWMLAAAGGLAACSLAPYALPLLGIGDSRTAEGMMHFMGGHATPTNPGFGIAGALQGAYAHLPLVGHALTSLAPVALPFGITIAAGALASFAAVTVLGIGGMLLANWLDKHEAPDAKIHWGKIVRTASLLTSTLIALPALLGGLSVGITFITWLFAPQMAANMILPLRDSIGASSMFMGNGAISGIAAILPHLITCGLPALSMLGAMVLGHKHMTANPNSNGDSRSATTQLVSCSPLHPGQLATLAFRIVDATSGAPLKPADLAITHTKKLHTMVVDNSLRDYQHIHPDYDPASGCFIARFTPRTAQPYMAWHDFTLHGTSTAIHCRDDLPFSGGPILPPSIIPQFHTVQDGMELRIAPAAPLTAGNAGMLTFDIYDQATGQRVNDLEPIMGASAHLVGFSRDGAHFVHCHPMERGAQSGGHLQFHITPETAGLTKFFLQIQRHGKIYTLPFGQRVRQPEAFAARSMGQEMAHGMAM